MKISRNFLEKVFIITFALLVQFASSQTRVTGHVINTNHNPIEKTEVLLRDASDQTILAHRITNHLGDFKFEVFKSGQYFIEYRRCGYEPMLSKIIEIKALNPSTKIDTMMLEKSLKQRHFAN